MYENGICYICFLPRGFLWYSSCTSVVCGRRPVSLPSDVHHLRDRCLYIPPLILVVSGPSCQHRAHQRHMGIRQSAPKGERAPAARRGGENAPSPLTIPPGCGRGQECRLLAASCV